MSGLGRDPDKLRDWQRRSRKPLKRSRIRPVSAKRQADRPRRYEVREALWKRDGGVCLLDDRRHAHLLAGPCFGGWTPHHLRKEKHGGTYTLDNLVTLCAGHNGWVEDYPPRARELGLVVIPGVIEPTYAAMLRSAHGLAR